MIMFFRLPKIKEYVDSHDPGAMVIPFSGAFESKMTELDDEGKKAYMEETKASGSVDILSIIVRTGSLVPLSYSW